MAVTSVSFAVTVRSMALRDPAPAPARAMEVPAAVSLDPTASAPASVSEKMTGEPLASTLRSPEAVTVAPEMLAITFEVISLAAKATPTEPATALFPLAYAMASPPASPVT